MLSSFTSKEDTWVQSPARKDNKKYMEIQIFFNIRKKKLKGPLKNILQTNTVSEMHSEIETRWDIGRETMIKTALCMWGSINISVL